MKKFIVIFSILLASTCFADDLTFQWDYGQDVIDGFNLYYGKFVQDEGGNWATQYITEPLLRGIPPDERSVTVEVLGLPNIIQKYCFVLRAEKDGKESADSNEICAKIDNSPILVPKNVAGSYDSDQGLIYIEWTQEDKERIKYWRIFYKIDGIDFSELGRLDNDGQNELKLSLPFTAIKQGEKKEVDFVIVAYKNYQNYSLNSDEITLVIDRIDQGPIAPVDNFRFKLIVEVE